MNVNVWPFPEGHNPEDHQVGVKQFLTFVVPAPGGCNLHCPFCFIRHRDEIGNNSLQPEDFRRFVVEANEYRAVFAIAIQGYEPLLPSSIPYTETLLSVSKQLNLPSSFVTNGTYLARSIDLLLDLSPKRIAISIDSHSSEIHDRIRGKNAFADTFDGISKASDKLSQSTIITITSVLLPNRKKFLEKMPRLLSDVGVDDWVLSPFLRFNSDGIAHIASPIENILEDVNFLSQCADDHNVRLTLDDPFGFINKYKNRMNINNYNINIKKPEKNVEIIRLSPDGSCSIGNDIVNKISGTTPRWEPSYVNAGKFLFELSRTHRLIAA